MINVSDITPIGQNFNNRVEGYRVYAALTEDIASPAEPGRSQRAGHGLAGHGGAGGGDAGAGRLRFYRQVVPTQDEQYYWVRPYHGEEDGSASNAVQVTAPPNKPPIAVLRA